VVNGIDSGESSGWPLLPARVVAGYCHRQEWAQVA